MISTAELLRESEIMTNVTLKAGKAILDVYGKAFEVELNNTNLT